MTRRPRGPAAAVSATVSSLAQKAYVVPAAPDAGSCARKSLSLPMGAERPTGQPNALGVLLRAPSRGNFCAH